MTRHEVGPGGFAAGAARRATETRIETTAPTPYTIRQGERPRHRDRAAVTGAPGVLPPGRMMGVGCGTGWDACYLARRGRQVTRVDMAGQLVPLSDELDRGVTFVLSSDSDVASFRPATSSRTPSSARPQAAGQSAPTSASASREALRAHTAAAAFAVHS